MDRAFNEKEISDFLFDIIGQNNKFNHQKIWESVFLVEIEKNLFKLLPGVLADHAHAHKYSSGKLLITTDHGIYAQQLQLYADKLLEQLRKNVTSDLMKIEIRIGNIYRKNQKTGDIMSLNEKMTNNSKNIHQNAELIDELIADLKKTGKNIPEEKK